MATCCLAPDISQKSNTITLRYSGSIYEDGDSVFLLRSRQRGWSFVWLKLRSSKFRERRCVHTLPLPQISSGRKHTKLPITTNGSGVPVIIRALETSTFLKSVTGMKTLSVGAKRILIFPFGYMDSVLHRYI